MLTCFFFIKKIMVAHGFCKYFYLEAADAHFFVSSREIIKLCHNNVK